VLGYQIVVCPVLSVTLVYYGQMFRWIKMKLGLEVGLNPSHIVLDRDPAPSSKRKLAQPLNFQPMSVVAKLLDGSRCHLYWGRPRLKPHCVRGPSSPHRKGHSSPQLFSECLLWPNGRPSHYRIYWALVLREIIMNGTKSLDFLKKH